MFWEHCSLKGSIQLNRMSTDKMGDTRQRGNTLAWPLVLGSVVGRVAVIFPNVSAQKTTRVHCLWKPTAAPGLNITQVRPGCACSAVQVRCTVGGEAAAGAGLLWSTLLTNTFNQAGHRCIVQWGEKTVLQVQAPNMIVSWASSPICTVLYWGSPTDNRK